MMNLQEINNVTVSSDDLLRINGIMVDFHEANGPVGDAIFHVVAQEYKDDIERGMVISLRLHALAKLVSDGLPAWTLPKQSDGAIPLRECLFAAAAVEPLVEVSGRAEFEKEAFLRKALEFSEMEGEA